MEKQKKLIQELKLKMKELGIQQGDINGISRQSVNSIISGKTDPKLSNLIKIVDSIGGNLKINF